jgi:hypothetical protein
VVVSPAATAPPATAGGLFFVALSIDNTKRGEGMLPPRPALHTWRHIRWRTASIAYASIHPDQVSGLGIFLSIFVHFFRAMLRTKKVHQRLGDQTNALMHPTRRYLLEGKGIRIRILPRSAVLVDTLHSPGAALL